jgi:hypothetical protein
MFYDAHSIWLEIIIISVVQTWRTQDDQQSQGCNIPGFTMKSPEIEFWHQPHLVRTEKSLYSYAS